MFLGDGLEHRVRERIQKTGGGIAGWDNMWHLITFKVGKVFWSLPGSFVEFYGFSLQKKILAEVVSYGNFDRRAQ